MKKIAVVYQSKYGATRRYARWLSEALSCDLLEAKKTSPEALCSYDLVLYGGGLYATGVAGLPLLRKARARRPELSAAVFAVGASPSEEKAVEAVRSHNMTGPLEGLPFFYLRGSFDEEAMNLGDRFLIRMLRKSLSKKDPSQYEIWERALAEAGEGPSDWTAKENLTPILEYVSAL